jgi:hypothetical protein
MLVVLGVHCLIGGGQTPILAAGFHTLSNQFGVSLTKIALTTGVYMLFLGIGSVILSPTALLYGKRPGISLLDWVNSSLSSGTIDISCGMYLVCYGAIMGNAPSRQNYHRNRSLTLRISSLIIYCRSTLPLFIV